MDEKEKKIQDYSLKVLMGEEPEGVSYAGIRLNGAALQALAGLISSDGRKKESLDRLILKLILHENLKAITDALDEYAESLRLGIAELEVERDQAASELEQIEQELAQVKEQLVAAREAIEKIEADKELALEDSGTRLKDQALEKLINGYEEKNGVQIDRGDSAYLLAVLHAEEKRLRLTEVQLGDESNAAKGMLDAIEKRLSIKRTELEETEGLLEEIDEISLIVDEGEREARLSALLDETPKHILEALAESDSFADGLKSHVKELLESRNEETVAADAFLDDILSEDLDEKESNASPELPKLG